MSPTPVPIYAIFKSIFNHPVSLIPLCRSEQDKIQACRELRHLVPDIQPGIIKDKFLQKASRGVCQRKYSCLPAGKLHLYPKVIEYRIRGYPGRCNDTDFPPVISRPGNLAAIKIRREIQ